jgi:excisionase family DNA binding protein
MERLLSVDETLGILGIKKATLYSWVCRRQIPVVKLSARLLKFRESDLEAFINARAVNYQQKPVKASRTIKAPNRPGKDIHEMVASIRQEVLNDL